ncbi:MAG: DUF1295 domain-containing protein [Candidatus Hydrogenedens sp.]|nr:DUF1295 domain-containing protein [Candidatus Hydrogenedens sp.]
MPAWSLPLVVYGGAVVLLTALYLLQLWTRDAGIVDAGWSGGIGLAVLFYGVASDASLVSRLAVMAIAVPWSARLAWYLITDRVLHGEEDARYASLREGWGDAAPRKFFLVFQMNAALVAAFSLPAWFVLQAGDRPPWLLAAGVALGWLAMAGESLADAQLKRWRADAANRGKTCRAGLWRYSRHPNYFFEWLHWWAYVLLCAGTWWMLTALGGPALMLLFLYRVTGIPYTERQALKSRGDDYREYQRTTSPFVPWPPRG